VPRRGVGMGMGMKYVFAELNGLADLFEERARRLEHVCKPSKRITRTIAGLNEIERQTWINAAAIIRQTEIVPVTNNAE